MGQPSRIGNEASERCVTLRMTRRNSSRVHHLAASSRTEFGFGHRFRMQRLTQPRIWKLKRLRVLDLVKHDRIPIEIGHRFIDD